MPNRLKFTVKAIENLRADPARRIVYSDTETPGFRLHVRSSGAKYFYLQKRVDGRAEQIRLGQFPELKLKDARQKAVELAGEIAKGINPQAKVRARRGELSLSSLFDEFMEQHITPYRKPKTATLYRSLYRTNLSHWKNRRLSEIRRRGIQRLHRDLGANSGPYTANRTLALLKSMYSRAIAWGLFEGQNPAVGVERFPERSRERFVQHGELPALLKALSEEPHETARDCLWVCLLTGARRGNVQSMRWADVDLDEGIWHIPDTKSGEPMTLPLAPPTVELLCARKAQRELNPWVFPSYGKSGHIVELKTVWKRVLGRAGLEDLRIHDLRRTYGSWLAGLGFSLPVIGKSLGHRSTSATAVYSRLDIDPLRKAAEMVNEAFLKAGELEAKSPKIAPLPQKAGADD